MYHGKSWLIEDMNNERAQTDRKWKSQEHTIKWVFNGFFGNNENSDDSGDGGLQIFFLPSNRSANKNERADMALAYAMHFVRSYCMRCKMDEKVKTKKKRNEMLKENGAQTKTKRLCSTIRTAFYMWSRFKVNRTSEILIVNAQKRWTSKVL